MLYGWGNGPEGKYAYCVSLRKKQTQLCSQWRIPIVKFDVIRSSDIFLKSVTYFKERKDAVALVSYKIEADNL